MFLACLFVFGFTQAQEVKPTYEKAGDLVKATYFYKDGSIKQQGFFKGKKLTGKWVSFGKTGERTAVAHYNNGLKVGKWVIWSEDGLKEINYKNNVVASVKTSYNTSRLAVK